MPCRDRGKWQFLHDAVWRPRRFEVRTGAKIYPGEQAEAKTENLGQKEKKIKEKKKKEEEGWGAGETIVNSPGGGSEWGMWGGSLKRPELKATEWVMALLLGVRVF